MPALRGPGGRDPTCRVRDLQLHAPLAVADGHARTVVARVTQDVRQRLLDDPVGAQVYVRRQRADVASDLQVDGKAGLLEALHQLGEVREARARRFIGAFGPGLAV